jgi:hypothetical protein
MRFALAILPAAALAACNPTNSLNGPLAFQVQNSGSIVELDGGIPWDAYVYIWGNVTDGGTELATVCNEVGTSGEPLSSAVIPDLVTFYLEGGEQGLTTGTYGVGGDGGGSLSATVVVSLGADGNQPEFVWTGVGGSVTVTSTDPTLLVGNFNLALQAVGTTSDAGSMSGSFAASPCKP